VHRARNQHASQHGLQLLCETCASRGAPPTPPLRATMTSHTTTRSLTTWTRFSATRVANTSSLWTSKATTETRMEMDTTHTWTCHAGTQLPMREGNVGAHKAGSAPPPAHHLTQGRSASCLDGGSAHHRRSCETRQPGPPQQHCSAGDRLKRGVGQQVKLRAAS